MSEQEKSIKPLYIKTYGLDEVRFGTDRKINLTNYLPEYLQNAEVSDLLLVFEDYLNNMFDAQKNYTIDERSLEFNICNTSACSTSAVDNYYELSSDDFQTSGTVLSPTHNNVGEIFISDIYQDKDNKISILEKISRLTELYDPELIPIDLIQYYAQNIGYNVGINRESMSFISDDEKAKDIEQRRYLRFMIRNLPNWYKIKSNRASISIMLLSFGLVGNFRYYYTKEYSDLFDNEREGSTIDIGAHRDFTILEYLRKELHEKDYINSDDITNLLNNNNDWILTTNNESSNIYENISEFTYNGDDVDQYFPTPHFRLWVTIDSDGNYSLDENKQRMVSNAIRAVKPVNTIYHGVTIYDDGQDLISNIDITSYTRMRGYIKLR